MVYISVPNFLTRFSVSSCPLYTSCFTELFIKSSQDGYLLLAIMLHDLFFFLQSKSLLVFHVRKTHNIHLTFNITLTFYTIHTLQCCMTLLLFFIAFPFQILGFSVVCMGGLCCTSLSLEMAYSEE